MQLIKTKSSISKRIFFWLRDETRHFLRIAIWSREKMHNLYGMNKSLVYGISHVIYVHTHRMCTHTIKWSQCKLCTKYVWSITQAYGCGLHMWVFMKDWFCVSLSLPLLSYYCFYCFFHRNRFAFSSPEILCYCRRRCFYFSLSLFVILFSTCVYVLFLLMCLQCACS